MSVAALATNTSKTASIIAGYRAKVGMLEGQISAMKYQTDRLRREKAQMQELVDAMRAERDALSERLAEMQPSTLSAIDVLNEVSRAHDVPIHVIKGPRRSVKLIGARHHAMYEVARRCHWMSLPELGRFFNRDHTTIIHALREWPSKAAKLGIHVHPLGRERSGE